MVMFRTAYARPFVQCPDGHGAVLVYGALILFNTADVKDQHGPIISGPA